MKGTKYLSDAIHMNDIYSGMLNLVTAPVGCGKTYWALNVLSQTVSRPYKMVYLIDTVNGKEQLLKHPNTQFYNRDWCETVRNGLVWFGEAAAANRIVVMTYAKFGVLAQKYIDFGKTFEVILCDEIHNLPRFSSFISHNPHDTPYHKIAKQRLEEIVTNTKVKVIGLSATPIRAVCEMKCKSRFVKVDDGVRQFETDKRFTYTNLEMLLPSLGLAERGLVYIGRIHQMKEFEEKAKQRGISAISIWSVNNQDHPMTEEQRRVRDYILTNAALPPEYDMFIINASSETSINIFGDLDYIVIHNQEEETQIQVRGRYRDDLDSLYVLNYDCVPYVPAEFMGVKLFTEDKKRLCEALSLRQDDGKKKAWPSTKKALINDGYTITEGRQNSKYYAIITR